MAAILLKRIRLTTSLALPPANGMITVIGRVGKPCALAVSETKAVVAHNTNANDVLNFMFLPKYKPGWLRHCADIRLQLGQTLVRNSISAS
jgi:hypothetical protein